MLKIHKQHKAKQYLISIWLYSFENFGIVQADKYLEEIATALNIIASNLEVDVYIDAIRKGYKKYQVNEQILFYKIKNSTIQVIRVLGNDMDYIHYLK